jgi:hypothetical protein
LYSPKAKGIILNFMEFSCLHATVCCAPAGLKKYDAGRLDGPSFTVGLRQETTVGLQVQGRLLANRRRKLQSQTFLGEHFCSLKYDEVRITAVACQR